MDYMGKKPVSPANIPPSVVHAARRDQRYFREISSPDVRWIYEAMDGVLDPMEYEGSLLFDEYPDAGEISRLTDQVLLGARKQGEFPGVQFCTEKEGTDAGSGMADAGRSVAGAGSRAADAERRVAVVGSDGVDLEAEFRKMTRELVRTLLCEEMCRRRFRHLMQRAGAAGTALHSE